MFGFAIPEKSKLLKNKNQMRYNLYNKLQCVSIELMKGISLLSEP